MRIFSVLLNVLIVAPSFYSAETIPPRKSARTIENSLYSLFVCKGKVNGLRLVVPGSCSQYYECFEGVSLLESCPEFFDQDSQSCVETSNCIVQEVAENDVDEPAVSQISTPCPTEPVTHCASTPDPCSVTTTRCPTTTTTIRCPTTRCPTTTQCQTSPSTECLTTTTTQCPMTTTTQCPTTSTSKCTTTTTQCPTTTTKCPTTTTQCPTTSKECLTTSTQCPTTSTTTTQCPTTTTLCPTTITQCPSTLTTQCTTTSTTTCPPQTTTSKPCYSGDLKVSELYAAFVCRGRPNGTLLISPDSRTNYYSCLDGRAVLQSCGKYNFNQETGQCEQCPTTSTTECSTTTTQCPTTTTLCPTTTTQCPTTSTTQCPTTSTTTCPPQTTTSKPCYSGDLKVSELYAAFVCRGRPNGTLLISPDSRTNYYSCLDGKAVLHSCGKYNFNQETGQCEQK